MLRYNMHAIPEAPLPAGFRMRAMTASEGPIWEEIWSDAEPFIKIEPGLFLKSFGDDRPAIPQRCFLLISPQGSPVGTISAWYSKNFKGDDWGRIHWVAIKKEAQGHGLARAMMTFAMHEMSRWHPRAMLDTSTGRVGAIKIYLDYGFVPDLEAPHAVEAWGAFKKKLNHPALARI